MSSVLTRTVARLLLLPILMVAIATLVKGYSQAGHGIRELWRQSWTRISDVDSIRVGLSLAWSRRFRP